MSETSHFEQFKKTFDAYFWKWWIVVSILYIVVYLLAFGLSYTMGFFNRAIGIGFISSGALTVGVVSIGALTVGVVSIGALTVGVVSIGAWSVGIVAVGPFSIGIFAFGAHSLGVIAIGAGTSYGTVDIGPVPRGRFDIGRAIGVIAISPEAYGVYTLSYTGRGVYMLSPDHQDADAVALFTRWMPKFKYAFSPTS